MHATMTRIYCGLMRSNSHRATLMGSANGAAASGLLFRGSRNFWKVYGDNVTTLYGPALALFT